MNSKIRAASFCASLPLLVALLTGCANSKPVAGQDSGLTDVERDLAARITRSALEERGLLSDGPAFFVGAELFRDKEISDDSRNALTTYYRYGGNTTFLTYVDLARQSVIRIDSVSRLPTALSPEELNIARDLALSDDRVQELLGEHRTRASVEALVIHTDDERDRFFNRRAVSLLFRVGSDYVMTPHIAVDLTNQEVIIEDG